MTKKARRRRRSREMKKFILISQISIKFISLKFMLQINWMGQRGRTELRGIGAFAR